MLKSIVPHERKHVNPYDQLSDLEHDEFNARRWAFFRPT